MPTTATSVLDSTGIYATYLVAIKFNEYCMGGYPVRADLVRAWIKAKTGFDDSITDQQVAEATSVLPEAEAKEKLDGCWTTFPKDEVGIFLEDRQLKAGYRTAMSLLGYNVKHMGAKQITQHGTIFRGLHHPTKRSRIHFERDGVVLTKPDETIERPIHVQTAMGSRDALKRVDCVYQAELQFELQIFRTGAKEKRHVPLEEVKRAFAVMQNDGLGADRSQEFGKFTVTMFEEV